MPKDPKAKSNRQKKREERGHVSKKKTEVDRYSMKTSDAAGGINLGSQGGNAGNVGPP
jgi:hypothetical protein